ncbi:glutamate-gated chloride channel-like [Penaeus chinensis]|uniref:glutamate-gated chloride channel-like n=1 Tax=Penaeus chinensis TaxID=139456 RepID=UPI001FB74831|nr:glutamate-gated chloride channel-like [Penaeus chinensis]
MAEQPVKMLKFIALNCILLVSAPSVRASPMEDATQEVMAKLKQESYNLNIRPSVDGGPTQVKLQAYIRDISVDDAKMEADIVLTFRMAWNDHRLAFSTARMNYVNILEPHLAWLPDAFFKNAITTQLEAIYPESYLRVFQDGHIIYSTRMTLKQRCPMNLVSFPHDSQSCVIRIASYGYTAADVNFTMSSQEVQIADNLNVEKFTLEGVETSYCTSKTTTGEYSCAQININLSRKFASYLLEWYVPVFLLITVAWFSFLIPADQFLARLLLTLIPLITLSSFNNVFRQSLASVNYTRALDVFTGVSTVCIFASLVHVIVCYLRGGGESDAGRDGLSGSTKRAALMKYLPLIIHVCCYVFFLFIYFVVYSFTG